MVEIDCPACGHDLSDRTEGQCPDCGYHPNWKVLLAQARLASDPIIIHCPGCGYDLRGTAEGDCPECGKPFDRDAIRQRLARNPTWWNAALVCFLIGPFVFMIVLRLLPRFLDDNGLWLIYFGTLLVGALVTAMIDAERLEFRRVVTEGKRPRSGYAAMIGLFEFACLAVVGLFMTGVAFMMLIGLFPHGYGV